ncbi:MAG: hypothetical protein H7Y20_08770 [Bryobacteraceae bacterium]|nr:hypothetical protein [Bryobacteraceae bacterium]
MEALNRGTGDPSQVVVALKLLARSARRNQTVHVVELPPSLDSMEAIAALEAAAALQEAGDLENTSNLLAAALDSSHLNEITRCDAFRRLALVKERINLRQSSVAARVSVEALHAEIWHLLHSGAEKDIAEAGRLCGSFPEAAGEQMPLVVHATICTALELEQRGRSRAAAVLYRKVLANENAPPNDRANGALRAGLILLAAGNRMEAIPLLRRALEQSEACVTIAASVPLLELLAWNEEWEEALSIGENARALVASDPSLSLFLDLWLVRCRAHLGQIDENDESAATILPSIDKSVESASAPAWMEAAFTLEQCGYLHQSKVFYELLLSTSDLPQGMRTNLHYRLGIVLDRLLYFDAAEVQLRAALESDDPFPAAKAEARLRLATLRFLMDEYESAMPDFRLLREDAGMTSRIRAEAQLRYATCLFRTGRQEEARTEFLECRKEGSGGDTEFEVKADLLLAELAEARNDDAEAIDCYSRLIRHPLSEPLTRAAALARSQALKRLKRRH